MMQARWGSHGDYEIIALCPNSPAGVLRPDDQGLQPGRAATACPVLFMMDEVRRPHDRAGRHPAGRRDRDRRRAAATTKARASTCPSRPDARPGARDGQGRRRLPHPRHRPDPRRARLPGHEPRPPRRSWSRRLVDKIRENARRDRRRTRGPASRAPRSWSSPTASPRASPARPSTRRAREGLQGRPPAAASSSGRSRRSASASSPTRVKALRRARAEHGPDGPRGGALRRRQGRGSMLVPHAGGTVHEPEVILTQIMEACEAMTDDRRSMDADVEHADQPGRCRSCAWTACRTSGARAAASAPPSTASPAPSTESGSTSTKVAIVSGIGCTGRVAGYMNLDSFHTTHGRAIPFATGLKLANPELKVVVYSRRRRPDRHRRQPLHPRRPPQHGPDGHLRQQLHLRHDRRPGGADDPARGRRPRRRPTATSRSRSTCPTWPTSCGAVYVARWTVYHVRQLAKAMKEALLQEGLRPSSRSSRPARRSTRAATGSATASTS